MVEIPPDDLVDLDEGQAGRLGGAKTLAEAARARRDIVSGEVMAEDRLIRFVTGPEGAVTPDLGRKLPGRGLWVAADRASVETAARRGLFSRAAKAKVSADPALADVVCELLRRRLLASLGLAKKAGELISGFEKVSSAIGGGKAAWLVEASDGAEDGRRKLLAQIRAAERAGTATPRVIGVFSAEELGLALGLENVIHTALLAGRGAHRWSMDAHRLSGFRPLIPEGWRPET
ncbi:RNA-binding protein [Phenylobacterium immobile]|uniref:RNA-binding protein n=1 Tax=Phenylobacterium immobile TaxID=21 RepID=UPI000A6E2DC0|nr:RNA-binding protein [Phenylobacterium immobile]